METADAAMTSVALPALSSAFTKTGDYGGVTTATARNNNVAEAAATTTGYAAMTTGNAAMVTGDAFTTTGNVAMTRGDASATADDAVTTAGSSHAANAVLLLEMRSAVKTLAWSGAFFLVIGCILTTAGALVKLRGDDEDDVGAATNASGNHTEGATTQLPDTTESDVTTAASDEPPTTAAAAPLSYPSLKELLIVGPIMLLLALAIWTLALAVRRKYVHCKVAPSDEKRQSVRAVGGGRRASEGGRDMVDEDMLQSLFHDPDTRARLAMRGELTPYPSLQASPSDTPLSYVKPLDPPYDDTPTHVATG